MSDIAIRVENLSKLYQIGSQQRHDTLRDALTATFRRGNGNGASNTDLWALKDVSFEVKRGEVVGVIGRNGAGKSTLLKILSRITEPTKGRVEIHGRVGSLLEVGTGFHPELTGRENIFLNGAILGMKRWEIAQRFDEIVAFSEIEKFLDTPVKRYSSGMYVRLAFAVAAHLEPEILLVDEVLAVGDAEFQKKCLGKMGDVAKAGRTVIFVSHNMGAISSLCERAIMLTGGIKAADDCAAEVIRTYLVNGASGSGQWARPVGNAKDLPIYFEAVCVRDARGIVTGSVPSNLPFTIEMVVRVQEDVPNAEIAVRLTNAAGTPILTSGNHDSARTYSTLRKGRRQYAVRIPGDLLWPGAYSALIAALIPKHRLFDALDGSIVISVEDVGSLPGMMQDARLGVVTPDLPWTVTELPTRDY